MIFACARCGYECYAKCHLKRHLQRKQPCKAINTDQSVETLIQELDDASKFLTGDYFQCLYCDKRYSESRNRYRHQRICKDKPESVSLDVLQNIQSSIINMQQKLDQMSSSTNITTVNNTNNNTNNTNNTNNIQININNFGCETYDHITNEFLKHCIMNCTSGIKTLIEKIHFSEEAPMNRNIHLWDKKENLVKVSNNERWEIRHANEAMETMIKKGCNLLNCFYTNPESGIQEIDVQELDNRISLFLSSIMAKDNNAYFELRKRIKALIIDQA